MFKNMGFVLGKSNGQALTTPHAGEKNFCSAEHFRQRLAIEKRRSERLNSKSSLVVLHLKSHARGQRNKAAFAKKSLAHLARMICTIIRETDAVSLHETDAILILLPDTDNQGAQKVCEKIKKLMGESAHPYLEAPKLGFDDFEVQILSYPEKSWMDSPTEIQEDGNKEGDDGEREKGATFSNTNGTHFKMSYVENLNLCVSSLNGTSFAIPVVDALFWDQFVAVDFFASANQALKKAIDFIGAIAALVLFSPVILLTAVLIKLTSPGPVLFRQERLGFKGKPFTFLKFRSMYINSEDQIHQEYVKKLIRGNSNEINNGSQESPFYKIKSDPRVTPIGRFIRKTSLDELPQLWNVLKGDMSLVGPRPPIPYEVKEYQNWHYRRVLEAKPGITGLWQVTGRNTTTFDDMVRLDIHYTQNWTLALDFKIMAGTIQAIFKADGR